jgi:magnesium transporter
VTQEGVTSKRPPALPTTKAGAEKTVTPPSGMKALILDGEVAKETSDFDELTKAHERGARFWVEFDTRTPEADIFLDAVLKIHPLAVEDVWNDIGIPKVEDFGDYVQLVMHGVLEADVGGQDVPLALTELDVLIGRNWLVTHAHDETVCAIKPVQAEVLRNARLLKKGPAWVAHAVLDRMVDEYLPIVDRFDAQIEEVELRILEQRKRAPTERGIMRQILRIKRSLQMLRRTTIMQREVLFRLARAEFDEIPSEAMPFYRDVYDHFARVTEMVDSYRELTGSLLEAHFSIQSQQMNEIMKRLTVMSTIMLPLTLIAGIYGMNFENMPELKWANGYYMALGLMAAVSISILVWFRKQKWL